MKLSKLLLVLLLLGFSLNAFGVNLKDKTSESFAYYYYQAKDYKHAIEEYKSILKSEPKNLKIRYNLACLYVATGDYPSAIIEFKKILKSRSLLKKDALYNLAVVYENYLNDNVSASKYYNKFTEQK